MKRADCVVLATLFHQHLVAAKINDDDYPDLPTLMLLHLVSAQWSRISHIDSQRSHAFEPRFEQK